MRTATSIKTRLARIEAAADELHRDDDRGCDPRFAAVALRIALANCPETAPGQAAPTAMPAQARRILIDLGTRYEVASAKGEAAMVKLLAELGAEWPEPAGSEPD